MTVNTAYKKWFVSAVAQGNKLGETLKDCDLAFNKTLRDCVNDNCVSRLLKMIEKFDLFQHCMLCYFGVKVTPENYVDFLFETINRFEKKEFPFDS